MLSVLISCCLAFTGCRLFNKPHVHDYYIEETIYPTCSETGYTRHTCFCGESYTDNHTPMTDHTPVTDAAVDASCTKTGLTEGSHCSECGKVLKEQTVSDMLAHTPVTDVPAQEPTCLADGQTGETHCGECKAILLANTVIPRLEHVYRNDICTTCHNYRPTEGLIYTLNADGNTYALTGTENASGIVHVAALYDGKRVTAIGELAFSNNSSVTCVTLPEGIEKIETSAFNRCAALVDLVIPSSVSEIGDYAFGYCTALNGIVIPKNVTKIGKGIFRGCSSLTSIAANDNPVYHTTSNCLIKTAAKTVVAGCGASVIPDDGSVTAIGDSAFEFCGTLNSIVIPQSVTVIGVTAFEGCGLTEIKIPSGVETLGNNVFNNCTQLENVTLHEGLKTIGSGAFYHCAALNDISFPSSVVSIGDNAFAFCSFTALEVPQTVTSIGEGAFAACTSLSSITIPFVGKSVNATRSAAVFGYIFGNLGSKNCVTVKQSYGSAYYASTTYYIPESLHSVTVTGGTIGYGAFSNCSMIQSVTLPEGISTVAEYAFSGCGFTEFTVPESVKTIGNYAFSGCLSLKNIVLPNGLEQIGSNALSGTTLEEAHVPASAIPALPYSKVAKLYVTGGNSIDSDHMNYNSMLEYVELADSITTMCKGVFQYCNALTSVKLPASLTAIPVSAFEQCKVLSDIEIGQNVTSVGDKAFKGCALLDITVPDNVTEMGDNVFDGTAYINNTSRYIGGLLYAGRHVIASNVAKDSSCTIRTGTLSVTSNVFENSPLTSITIPASMSKFGWYTFKNCNSLSSVYFLSDADDWSRIKFLSKDSNPLAFADDFYINGILSTSLTLSDSVTAIGNYAFINRNYTELILPDSVQTVGWYAFENCPITRLVGKGLTEIGMSAFENCSALTEVTLGDDLKTIKVYAFRNCSSLKEISIPKNVTEIGPSSFEGCGALESMTLPFVGMSADATEASSSTLFGVLFGTNSYDGAQGTIQRYGDKTDEYVIYYIPSNLTQVTVTGGKLFRGAFNGCSKLTQAKIIGTASYIGTEAFKGCFRLESAEIGADVVYIGYDAFYGCDALKSVHLYATSGWTCYKYSNSTSGAQKPSTANPGLIATALTKTYRSYFWKRE